MKKSLKYLTLYSIYVIFLFICYNVYLIDVYGYYGFENNMTVSSLTISIIILIISFTYVCKQKTNSYSKLIVYILFLINFIPSVVTFAFNPCSYKFLILLSTYWILLVLFTNFFNKININDNKKFKTKLSNVYFVIIIEFAVVALVITKYTGINLSFEDVYTLRENYFESNMPTVLAYLFAAFKVVNPLLFIYLYNKKKKMGYVFSVIIQILAFLCDGSKSTIFSILLAFIILKCANKKKILNFLENENSKLYLLFGLVMVNLVGYIEFAILKSSILYNYFIRRLFFVPSLLNQYYYDYFSTHTFDYFRQSILGKLGMVSPYGIQIPKIIGAEYFNAPDMLANNGLFSDAYMNLGIYGVFIMPFVLGITFRFLDYCAKNIRPIYLITILISVSYVFISSSYFTVLMTHGYLILCLIILIIIPKDDEMRDAK